MKKKTLNAALTALGLSLLAACLPVQAAETILATSDAEFLKQAAHNGLAEIEASRLLQQNGSDPKLKAYAADMISDHSRVAEELKQLAANKQVALDDGPSSAQRAELKLLHVHKGDKLDEAYVRSYGIKLHQNTILLFRNAIGSAKDPQVKAFAEKTLPGLEHHLQMAETITR